MEDGPLPWYEAAPLGAFPDALRVRERKLLLARRLKALPGAEDLPPERREALPEGLPRVGLALSGGGIRSATFGLGVLQALARLDCMGRVDYLSTVSGGGYIGTFLGGLYQMRVPDARKRAEVRPCTPAQVRAMLLSPRELPVRFLRENGRYLTPGGSGDLFLAAAVTLRNYVALLLVMGIFALMGFLGLELLRPLLEPLGGLLGPMSPDLAAHSWLSPWLFLPALAALAWVVPAGWAYWLVRGRGLRGSGWPPILVPLALLVLLAPVLGVDAGPLGKLGPLEIPALMGVRTPALCLGLWFLILLTLLFYVGAQSLALVRNSRDAVPDEDPVRGPRTTLTSTLRAGLIFVLLALYVSLVDTLAQSVYGAFFHRGSLGLARWMGGGFASLLALVTGARPLMVFLEKRIRPREGGTPVPWSLLAGAGAFLLGTLILAALDLAATGVARAWTSPAGAHPGTLLAFAVTLLLAVILGRTYEFLNLSSQGPFYSSMLTRAYLGASNWVRHGETQSPPYVVAGDDVASQDYAPHLAGGPLHFVNVCLNETFGGESEVNQRDRKGLGLARGPAGYTLGVSHHALRLEEGEDPERGGLAPGDYGVFHLEGGAPFQPEALTMGRWMGISGAAASTGMGQLTSPALSLLCGVFNVRLGYWWDSGVSPHRRAGTSWHFRFSALPRWAFPVQGHLLDEFMAHFPGSSARQWYLSDGGHFENLGAYELLRRRVPLVVVVDSGADPDSGFRDLDNLVRKARTDFGAEIAFLDRPDLDRLAAGAPLHAGGAGGWNFLGTLEDLRRMKVQGGVPVPSREGFSRAHAALARVRYDRLLPGDPLGEWEAAQRKHCGFDGAWLLYLKPTLLDDPELPLDVRTYHAAHPDFPHQTTGDQFFDEAQWESYRRLGEHVALRVLGIGHEEAPWSWRPGPFWGLGPTCAGDQPGTSK